MKIVETYYNYPLQFMLLSGEQVDSRSQIFISITSRHLVIFLEIG